MATERTGSSGSKGAGLDRQSADPKQEHDQDSDPPRTAVPPGGSKKPFESPGSSDPTHDQDSDPPRTAVPPKK